MSDNQNALLCFLPAYIFATPTHHCMIKLLQKVTDSQLWVLFLMFSGLLAVVMLLGLFA